MTLEAKIDYILRSNAAVQVSYDKHSLDDFDKLVPEIMQAIKDEGYEKKSHILYGTKFKPQGTKHG